MTDDTISVSASTAGAGRLLAQTLLIDADDTLWENNIYFERAISSFISYLDHQEHTPEEVREHLNRVERATVAEHGYGHASFERSLIRCFEELTGGSAAPTHHQEIVSFARTVVDHAIETLDGVDETLLALSRRHRLLLVTKGNEIEQRGKLDRSGFARYFSAVEVLTEKNIAAYVDLIGRYGLEHASTWMIGNSPKSDINPALAAGFHAVFVPHDQTWVLERETLDMPGPGRRLLELGSFGELLDYF